MKKYLVLTLVVLALLLAGCTTDSAEYQDKQNVEEQQSHYQKVHPVPFYDYSIPRDVLVQIYNVVTTKAFATYTVIESITGEVKFHGPSVGYGIPADTQLTNPLRSYGSVGIIEQAEPNGLFSSKNTDGTWVLFVQDEGKVVPIYTEHKVTTFPFPVDKTDNGWVRVDGTTTEFTIDVKR